MQNFYGHIKLTLNNNFRVGQILVGSDRKNNKSTAFDVGSKSKPFSNVSQSLSSVVVFGSLLQFSGVLVTTAYVWKKNHACTNKC